MHLWGSFCIFRLKKKSNQHSGILSTDGNLIKCSLFSPGWRCFGPLHIEAASQSHAVFELEWLLLAVWLYDGASGSLQRSDTPGCHRLSHNFPASLPSPLLPFSAQIPRFWCDAGLQLCSAQFRGGGFSEPPVGAQTDTADTELWCGAMLRPTTQVRICAITEVSHEAFVQNNFLFDTQRNIDLYIHFYVIIWIQVIMFMHHVVS